MTFLPGNEYWKLRTNHGVKRKFETSEDLRNACFEYITWVHDNPIMEDKASVQGGEVIHYQLPKMRALTQGGLCLHIGITQETWITWRGQGSDLSEVVKEIDEIIKVQKFEGAAADMLNSNIIARDLGLADKKENEISGNINYKLEDLSDDELKARLKALESE